LLINALFPCASEALCELDLTISGGGESFIFPLLLLQGGFQNDPFTFADLDGGQAEHAVNFAAAQAMSGCLAAADEACRLGQ